MLLAADIGNTHIVLGVLEGEKVLFEMRLATDRGKTSDQYAMEILKILSLNGIRREQIEDCILSSVVPPVMNAVRSGMMKILHREPLVVGPGVKTGLNIRMDDPSSVGTDRIVIAVGALSRYEPPMILMDFGTATTMEVIDPKGTYVGGCIIPGVRTALDGLISKTAQLPNVALEAPEKIIGTNTEKCIRSGLIYGAAAMTDGMIERTQQELGASCRVIATGGLAHVVIPLCKQKVQIEDDLLIEGLRVIYEKNRKRRTMKPDA